jgi:hypothetical protein
MSPKCKMRINENKIGYSELRCITSHILTDFEFEDSEKIGLVLAHYPNVCSKRNLVRKDCFTLAIFDATAMKYSK